MLIRVFFCTVCLALIAGCCHTQTVATDTMAQTLDVGVLYRERMMLPPGSQLEVTLSDVSKMDVPAEVISTVTQDIKTAPPYNVSLPYNEDQILPNHRYSVRAKITNDGKLVFTSTTALDPFKTDERPVEIITEKVAAGPAMSSGLENTQWQLLTVKGKKIAQSDEQKAPFLLLKEEDNRAGGFSGCNNFTGSYTVDGSKLSFSQLAATMKMCIKGIEEEQMFLAAIEKTAGYELNGKNLKLIDGTGAELATFKAGSM